MSPEFAVDINARNAPTLINTFNILPPKTPALSEIGLRVDFKTSGSNTPIVTKITRV